MKRICSYIGMMSGTCNSEATHFYLLKEMYHPSIGVIRRSRVWCSCAEHSFEQWDSEEVTETDALVWEVMET